MYRNTADPDTSDAISADAGDDEGGDADPDDVAAPADVVDDCADADGGAAAAFTFLLGAKSASLSSPASVDCAVVAVAVPNDRHSGQQRAWSRNRRPRDRLPAGRADSAGRNADGDSDSDSDAELNGREAPADAHEEKEALT